MAQTTKPNGKTSIKANQEMVSEQLTQLKEVTKTVNETVSNAVNEGMDQLKEAGKSVNTAVTEGFGQLKETAKNVNDFAFKTTEELLSAAISTTEQWQGLALKAVNGSLELMTKQQELTFAAVEGIKAQVEESTNRAKTVFGF